MEDNNTKYLVNNIIIAGPGQKKHFLNENNLIQQYFKNKIRIITTNELIEEEIFKTINNCKEFFDFDINNYSNKILNEIKDLMIKADDKLVFGIREITEGLNTNTLQKVIIDEELENIIQEPINKCEIIKIPTNKMKELGINIIGIKWY